MEWTESWDLVGRVWYLPSPTGNPNEWVVVHGFDNTVALAKTSNIEMWLGCT